MSSISDLKPRLAARVIDLVAAAGHDVSDWKNFKGGVKREASNPKYCYEWAFVQSEKPVVLCLWYDQLQDENGEIFQHLNYRQEAMALPQTAAKGTRLKRARAMDEAFALAASRGLSIRVIICDGNRIDVAKNPMGSSSVSRRKLDPIPWSVTNYDKESGACTITRGTVPTAIEDQFDRSNETQPPDRHPTTSNVFVRDRQVRNRVKERAMGFCEYCSQRGFEMGSGTLYIETHHIIPLSEFGVDTDSNVIALCPNDHRRAHHARDSEKLRDEFKRIVETKLKLSR